MKREFVSRNGQMEFPVSVNVSFKKGHRCGACHNASNAKVRIKKAIRQYRKVIGIFLEYQYVYLMLPMQGSYICDFGC